jgi:hypothetical protein
VVRMCSDLYKNTLSQYLENKYVAESTGFKPLAETINGRAAMLVRGCCSSADADGCVSQLAGLTASPPPSTTLKDNTMPSNRLPPDVGRASPTVKPHAKPCCPVLIAAAPLALLLPLLCRASWQVPAQRSLALAPCCCSSASSLSLCWWCWP